MKKLLIVSTLLLGLGCARHRVDVIVTHDGTRPEVRLSLSPHEPPRATTLSLVSNGDNQ